MKNLTIILVVFLLGNNYLFAQQDAKFQAIFLYNFTRQLGWPDDYRSGDIIIKVLGDSDVVEELNNFAKNNPVNGQNVVSKATNTSSIGKCHILFIPASKTTQLASVVSSVKNQSTLIVTESAGQTSKGAGISFVNIKESDGSNILKYQYNVKNISSKNIKVSSNFMTLGIAQ